MEQKHVLSNGVRVLMEEIPHVRSASVGFWIDTGSKNETPEINGISHFIEHMLFKGTHTRSALEIARTLEDKGGALNAFTDKEQTCFYARVLDTEVALAIDLLSDMVLHPALDPAELKRERQVVLEEIKMYEDTPDELVQDLFNLVFFKDHPLGMPIAGTRTTMRGVSRQDVLDYLDRFYTPDRIVVAIAGRFDPSAVLDQLERTIGRLERPATRLIEVPPVPQSAIKVKYKDIEQAHVCLGTEGVAISNPDRYVVTILDAVLGGGMSSRLFQEVREKRGMAYSISSYEIMYENAGVFGVYAGCSPKHLDEVIRLSLEELDKAKGGDITEDELQRTKDQLKGGMLLSLETPRNRMSRMARNELSFGRLITPEEILTEIDRVTVADLTRVARQIFDTKTLTATVVGPTRKLKLPGLVA
ncbi:MAG TPA: pitrilysin family protein [Stenomitos sp.]